MPFKQRGGYRGQVRHQGQKYTSESLYKTERDAKDWEAEKRKELRTPKVQTLTDTDFETAFNDYLDHVKLHNSDKTHYEKSQAGAMFIAANGNMALKEILPEHIRKTMVLAQDKSSNNRANKDRKNLGAFFTWLVKYRAFPTNPVYICEKLHHDREPQYTPPEKDVLKVVMKLDRYDRLFLMCYVQVGARRSEVFKLKWSEDIDLVKGTIRLGTLKNRKKQTVYRKLPMSEQLWAEMTWWYENRTHKDSPYVFTVRSGPREGQPYVTRRWFLERVCKSVGLSQKFTYKPLRRFFANNIVNVHGKPIAVAQRFLGHQKEGTTEVYIDNMNEDLRQYAELTTLDFTGKDAEKDAKSES